MARATQNPIGPKVDAATYDSKQHAFVLTTQRGDFARFVWKGKQRYIKVDSMTGFGLFGWDPETGKYWRVEYEYVIAIVRPQDRAYEFMKHPIKFPKNGKENLP